MIYLLVAIVLTLVFTALWRQHYLRKRRRSIMKTLDEQDVRMRMRPRGNVTNYGPNRKGKV